MFPRLQVFFLFSLVSSVLVDATRNRCHPENGANRCFDLANPCPWDIVNSAAREGMQVCPETPILTSVKRCAATQTFQCFDPDEEPCTTLEAQKSLAELRTMQVCVDKAHKLPRWSVRHPSNCLFPTEPAFDNERLDTNLDGGTALTVCADARIDAGKCRHSSEQAYPCKHPGTDGAASCPSPILQGLPLCYDEAGVTGIKRCDPKHVTPCIDPTQDCPYSIQNKTARVNLPICVGKEVPTGDLPRCHSSHGDKKCIDPTEVSTTGGNGVAGGGDDTTVGGTCNLHDNDFANLKLCVDRDHLAKRCHPKRRGPALGTAGAAQCLHPTEECFGDERPNNIALCPDIQADYANFGNRCAVENGDLRCRGVTASTDPLCAGLKYCTDLQGVPTPEKRCDPNQITPCIDPMEECPYTKQNKTARVNLPICVGKEVPTGDLPRCHASHGDKKCIDPTEVSTTGGNGVAGGGDDTTVGGTCNLHDNDFVNLKLCVDRDHLAKRCHPKRLGPAVGTTGAAQCLHPTEECFGDERPNNIALCPDIQADYANFGNRCAVENGDLRCRGVPDSTDPLCAGLKYCTDLQGVPTPEKRCDPNQITPCIDPNEECPYSKQNITARQELPLCYGRTELINQALTATPPRPRCHILNDPAVRCINPNELSTGETGAAGGTCADTQTNVDGLRVCEEFSHQLLRCDKIQRGRCFDPEQSCFGLNRHTDATDDTSAELIVCADKTPTTGMSRCDPRQSYRCIDPRQSATFACADQASLKLCNDIPKDDQGNRCQPSHITPCLSNEACTAAHNPNGGALKICPENVADFARCDIRQQNPCVDPKPPTGKHCTIELYEEHPPGALTVCPGSGGGRSAADRCKSSVVGADNVCKVQFDTGNADQCDGTTKICQDILFLQNMVSTTTATAANGQFCHANVLAAQQCLKTGLNPAQAAGAPTTATPNACMGGINTPCKGFEYRCSRHLPGRCLEVETAKACFDADTSTLSRCAGITLQAGKKRCDDAQTVECLDPLEAMCTTGEFTGTLGDLKFCGDKAHLMPRSHPNQASPCLDPAQESLPTRNIATNAEQDKAAVALLGLCTEPPQIVVNKDNLKRCHPSQNHPCINPPRDPEFAECTAADNPNFATLKYCGDRVAKLLNTANEVNRCDPLNMNPCIDPTVACPFEFLASQPNLQVCADLLPPPGTKRCHTSQTNSCYFVGTDGTPETCTTADNPNFATLKVCPDAATRVNRCSTRQLIPCKDPANPCSAALNPNMVTLGICTDLVSMAPSTLPSQIPSNVPSNVPSFVPSSTPSLSVAPSDKPSLSAAPSASPSDQPSASPSDSPSASPSESPSDQPSASPSDAPSAKPSTSASPSAKPSPAPSESPSGSPSSSPSASPTLSSVPSATPSFRPTVSMKPTFKGQTYEPSDTPSASPSASPSEAPSSSPSVSPSSTPSASPSSSPSSSPSASPSSSPSSSPSASPTLLGGPSAAPSVNCVDDPDFLLDENENRNCEWARENPDRVEIRCAKVDSVTNVAVADACPLSCNPECEEFVPTVTPVTSEPTVSPETQCGEDDPDFLFQNREGKNCEWVASRPNKTEKRCDKTDTDGELVSTKCTFTCQLRCACRNSKKKFRLNGEKVKCKDVGRNQCDQGVRFRGRNTFVKERCPKKCNYCFNL